MKIYYRIKENYFKINILKYYLGFSAKSPPPYFIVSEFKIQLANFHIFLLEDNYYIYFSI